jgi:LysR family glycine cleavage system transcriptional activator
MQKSTSSLPPLASLRAFEAVSRLGSVRIASEFLKVTPSAISHQLRVLEGHFGVQLIKLTGRTISLTAEGAIYAPIVIRAFSELFRANELLERRQRDPLIRVSVTPTFATLAALPHLEAFRVANPHVDLRLEARNTTLDFERELIDAAVCVGNPPFPGLSSHRLFWSKMMPLAHPKLWKKFEPIETAKDLARMPLIEFNTAAAFWQKWFAVIDPTIRADEPYLSSDSLLTAIQMAEAGMGVILAPFPLIVSKVINGALCPSTMNPRTSPSEMDFYFVYQSVNEGSPKIRIIHRWLKGIAKNLETEAQKTGF